MKIYFTLGDSSTILLILCVLLIYFVDSIKEILLDLDYSNIYSIENKNNLILISYSFILFV